MFSGIIDELVDVTNILNVTAEILQWLYLALWNESYFKYLVLSSSESLYLSLIDYSRLIYPAFYSGKLKNKAYS